MTFEPLKEPTPPSCDELDGRRALSFMHAIESAIEVRRKYQFFVWTQGRMQSLLPHKLAICGVYDRNQKELRLEVFNSVLLPAATLSLLTDGQSPLMQHLVNAWINNRGRPLLLHLAALTGRAVMSGAEALIGVGCGELLVHGVSRPQRANEIETLFIFASPDDTIGPLHLSGIEFMMPHLHSTYLRVQSIELEMGETRDARAEQGVSKRGDPSATLSDREAQVLNCVREGLSNQEIGVQLSISPLTVKNHIQKILRKLGATNRAQAVARAMSMNLLNRPRE